MDHLDFWKRRTLFGRAMADFLRRHNPISLLVEMHGNIGDHLIWMGTRDFLSQNNIRFKEISISRIGKENHEGILLIPGSGAWDTRWHEWLPDLAVRAAAGFEKVIVLPSSYEPTVPIVRTCLELPNVYAFARETSSFRHIQHFGRSAPFFDLALYHHRFTPGRRRPRGFGNHRLVALRCDSGSLLAKNSYAPNLKVNNDISLTLPDLDSWLDAIDAASSIVTDRLHIAVASILLGKELIYLDPYSKKLSTYFDFVFRTDFAEQITLCDLVWLERQGYIVREAV
jgi:hypothetical protein